MRIRLFFFKKSLVFFIPHPNKAYQFYQWHSLKFLQMKKKGSQRIRKKTIKLILSVILSKHMILFERTATKNMTFIHTFSATASIHFTNVRSST